MKCSIQFWYLLDESKIIFISLSTCIISIQPLTFKIEGIEIRELDTQEMKELRNREMR